MHGRDHIIAFFAAAIVTFSQTAPNGIHQRFVALGGIAIKECLAAYFQSKFKTVERLAGVPISYVRKEGKKIGRKRWRGRCEVCQCILENLLQRSWCVWGQGEHPDVLDNYHRDERFY